MSHHMRLALLPHPAAKPLATAPERELAPLRRQNKITGAHAMQQEDDSTGLHARPWSLRSDSWGHVSAIEAAQHSETTTWPEHGANGCLPQQSAT